MSPVTTVMSGRSSDPTKPIGRTTPSGRTSTVGRGADSAPLPDGTDLLVVDLAGRWMVRRMACALPPLRQRRPSSGPEDQRGYEDQRQEDPLQKVTSPL